MPAKTYPWTGLRSSLRRRLSQQYYRVAPEPTPNAASRAEAPLFKEATAYLDEQIRLRYNGRDDAHKWMASDLNHARRFVTSLTWTPDVSGRVLDPAAGNGLFSLLIRRFRKYQFEVPGYYNLEKDPAPYADESLDGAILMEVLEHFTVDPMFCLVEFNRILKPGGFLFLTTPNIASWVSLANLINHHTPYVYGMFERHHCPDRHNREYTWLEVGRMAEAAGFDIERLEAITVYPAHDAVPPIWGVDPKNRGDTTFLLARKAGPVRERYCDWLYENWAG